MLPVTIISVVETVDVGSGGKNTSTMLEISPWFPELISIIQILMLLIYLHLLKYSLVFQEVKIIALNQPET